jgi:transketolase
MKRKIHQSMRGYFAYELEKSMIKNDRIWVITGDLGYKMWDFVRSKFPKRFINVGASEQSMLGIAVGLALEGKIPIVYSITTFLLYRPFETIRNYINNEKIAVKLVGSGRDKDYAHDGISHWACEDEEIMKVLSNIHSVWPKDKNEMHNLVKNMLSDKRPWYVNLKK